MSHPEHKHSSDLFSAEIVDVNRLLAEIDRRLEQIDGNENVIERTAQRDALLELRDSLEAEIDLKDNDPLQVIDFEHV
jgi:hypothetical protein